MSEEKVSAAQVEQPLPAGTVIARRRKALGFSQETLAEKLDVSRQAVAKWESGQAFPTAERLAELCRVLEVTPGELLGLEEPQKKKRPWGLIVFAAGLILLWGVGLLLLPGNGGMDHNPLLDAAESEPFVGDWLAAGFGSPGPLEVCEPLMGSAAGKNRPCTGIFRCRGGFCGQEAVSEAAVFVKS